MNYQIGDFIIRLKNASLARRRSVVVSYSNVTKAIADILVKEGYLKDVKKAEKDGKNVLIMTIRYEDRMPIFDQVLLFSKPSLRVYQGVKHLQKAQKRGLGIEIISTNQGIMTTKEAKKKGVGGELLFRVW